ncbi:oligosaccharide repeat unit polymerase [Leptospira inadai serovar Lyme str. 10]|uniref:Oligosaccharide repeat unit polymerase n=2 Tax=Leptospira inadai serovar Lyme TaxID=293084 RepID=V6HCG3_9LEPT|nr:O-antigen polymerase [Leptospira inadai]EQA36548.1 oligosaccharide repeat unit polymerase [Leptospira inadai serovar Lyme str. 10]
MSEIILIAGVLNISISLILLRKAGVVLAFILAWWFFWMFISSLSLTGLFRPTSETYLLYILMLSSVTLGVGLHIFSLRVSGNQSILVISSIDEESAASKERFILRIMYFILFPIVLFFSFKAVYLLCTSVAPVDYRADVFGLRTGQSVLFGSTKINFLYGLLISPMLLASLFIGVAFYLTKGNGKIFTLACILVGLDAFMMFGRFGFHYIVMIGIIVISIKLTHDWKNTLSGFSWRTIIVLLLILLPVFLVGYLRENKASLAYERLLKLFVIDYHTMSFSMFDVELQNPLSIVHQTTYGRSSFAGLERPIAFISKFFGIRIEPQADVIGSYLHEYKTIGQGANGNAIKYNAFGSLMFSLYRDGGPFFIGLMGILFGFFVSKTSISIERKNTYGVSILMSLFFIGIYGIFQPVLNGPILLAILFIFLIFKVNLKHFGFVKGNV